MIGFCWQTCQQEEKIVKNLGQKHLKKHFQDCNVFLFGMVEILAKENLFTLEALFTAEIKPSLNTKDEFKSRNLQLKF